MVTTRFMRRLTLPSLLAALTLLLFPTVRLAADLVWTPDGGWRVEGGALAALDQGDSRNALDLMNKARRAEEAGSSGRAIKLYDTVGKKYPNSVFAAEALYRVGTLRQKRRQYHKAFDAYQNVLARYPNSDRFTQILGEQYRIASDLNAGKRNYIWGIIPGFRNPEKALAYYEAIVQSAPYSDYAPLALMNAARGYKKLGETEAAIYALDRMINTYPRNTLTPDAYLKIAQTHAALVDGPYYDQASTKESITYYEDYMILFPGDVGMASAEKGLIEMKTVLAQSSFTLADYYYRYRKNYQGAKVFYNQAITDFPDSEIAAKARAQLVLVEAKLVEQAKLRATRAAQPPAPAKKKKKRWLF